MSEITDLILDIFPDCDKESLIKLSDQKIEELYDSWSSIIDDIDLKMDNYIKESVYEIESEFQKLRDNVDYNFEEFILPEMERRFGIPKTYVMEGNKVISGPHTKNEIIGLLGDQEFVTVWSK